MAMTSFQFDLNIKNKKKIFNNFTISYNLFINIYINCIHFFSKK